MPEYFKNIVRALRRFMLRQMACLGQQVNLLNEFEKALIISPHPDDEVMGCGGMLAMCTTLGKKTNVLFITNGEASHKDCCAVSLSEISAQREKSALEANMALGVTASDLQFLKWQDGAIPLDGHSDFIQLTEIIAAAIKQFKPDVVFCPHPFEGWSDHVAAEQLTRAALKILKHERIPKLYHYCVWFWFSMPLRQSIKINWRNARLLDISQHFFQKCQALSVYLNAISPCGNPWIGKLPLQLLKAFNWHKELFFEANNDY